MKLRKPVAIAVRLDAEAERLDSFKDGVISKLPGSLALR
jgi:hypothetical protein